MNEIVDCLTIQKAFFKSTHPPRHAQAKKYTTAYTHMITKYKNQIAQFLQKIIENVTIVL